MTKIKGIDLRPTISVPATGFMMGYWDMGIINRGRGRPALYFSGFQVTYYQIFPVEVIAGQWWSIPKGVCIKGYSASRLKLPWPVLARYYLVH